MNKNQTPLGHVNNANRIPDLLKQTKEDMLTIIDDVPRGRKRAACRACHYEEMGINARLGYQHTCGK